MDDSISRQAAIDAICKHGTELERRGATVLSIANHKQATIDLLESLPSAQSEPLTDKEQRIFLAAMGRKEKVCKKVDAEMPEEPYEDSLVRVCREIERKVKKALWTN